MLAPDVAAWALNRIRAEPRLEAELARHIRRVKREAEEIPSPERVLRADPITIGTLVLTTIGITGATATVAAVVGTVVLAAVSIGVNYAISALSRPSGQGPLDSAVSTPSFGTESLNSQAIKYNERQAIPRKRIIYGTAQVGGALFFEAVKPPFLFQGLLICAKQVTAFRKVWIGANEVAFAALGPGTLQPILSTTPPDYSGGNLKLSLRLGTATQAIDPILATNFTSLDAQFRQRGIATAVLQYAYGTDITNFTELWGQVSRPNPLFLVDGVAVPDPRNPAHVLQFDPSDPDATAAAEATWSFSNNAALVQTHYLIQRYGGRIDPRRIDWDKVATAADWDDGLIARADGTFLKRHTIDGVVTMNQSPATVLSGMIAANRGFVLESAGRVWVSSSVPRSPVVTIHDRLLTGAVEYRAAKPKRDLANRVKVRFVAAEREYQMVDGPVLANADLKTADGELLDATLDLPFSMDTGNVARAQRLQKAFLATNRLGRQVSCRCDVALLADCADELVGSAVTFDSNLFAVANGIYLCTDWGFADNFSSVQLELVEYDPDIETDWHAADDEQSFTLAPLNLS